jgi:ectoine hydroxylase-related dioxygenase (phytanoyl-CoA dioxygenase family)
MSAASAVDLAIYATQGYLVVPQLLDAATVDALKHEARRFDDGRYSLGVQVQLVHRSAVIRRFVTTGPQIAYATTILGPNVCFTHQQFVVKHPDAKAARTDVPWHQDNGYGTLDPPDDLTVWIALDDTDERNGCLWVLPESHGGGARVHERRGALYRAEVDEAGVALPMRAGDAVLFGGLLLHRSLPNETTRARYALYLRYCLPTVVMTTHGGKPVLDDGFSWMVAGEAP